MTKRTQYQLDPNADELESPGDAQHIEYTLPENSGFENIAKLTAETSGKLYIGSYGDTLQRLLDSGVVVAAEGAISWREGHLEHVAALYASDPARAWRDYADDLTVALAADGSNFAALVERARGE